MKVFFIGFWGLFDEVVQERYAFQLANEGKVFKSRFSQDWEGEIELERNTCQVSKEYKIFNSRFTEGWTKQVCFFLDLLELVFNEKIEIGSLENSEILFESVFAKKTLLNYKKWKYTFLFSGESDRRIWQSINGDDLSRRGTFNEYSCYLKGEKNNGNIINLPFYVHYIYCFNFYKLFMNIPKPITAIPIKKVCVIVSNGHDNEGRNWFFEQLEKHISIDYAGRYKNNVPRIEHDYCTDDFIKFVSQYKFIVAMENSKNETYITEKILHGFSANTIPIYWGSDYVAEYFNEDRFINVKSFDAESTTNAIKRILEIDNDDEKYLQMVNSPIYSNNNNNNSLFKLENVASEIRDLILKN
jgi:hypothetical protein